MSSSPHGKPKDMETWTFKESRPPGVGPWNDEPDKARWVDEATGLDCIILRHPRHGNLNGYVAVPKDHPLYGKDYGAAEVEVHGGLTFAGPASGPGLDEEFQRQPHSDRPQDVWWFGFDCHHAWDLAPTFDAKLREISGLPARPTGIREDVYRPFGYVKAQVESLAGQLSEMKS